MNSNATQRMWWVVGLVIAVVFGVSLLVQCWTANTAVPESDPRPCMRVISLAPSVTEMLFVLGMGDRVVGATRYCDYPEEAIRIPRVGGYYDPNYEAIAAAKPDLVILLEEHHKPRDCLAAQGIRTLTVNHRSIDGIIDSIRRIGEAGGVPERADAVITDLRKRTDSIAARTRGLERPTVLAVVGRDVASGKLRDIHAAGKGWYNELIEMAGGVNAFQGDFAFPAVSAESILSMNPTVIVELLGDMSGSEIDPELAMKPWLDLPQVSAVKNHRVHLVRDEYVVTPGPRFILVLERLVRLLHPELDWPDKATSVGAP